MYIKAFWFVNLVAESGVALTIMCTFYSATDYIDD